MERYFPADVLVDILQRLPPSSQRRARLVGLLCLCDNDKQPGGAITVVNPVTGETLPVPPLPCPDLFVRYHGWKKWHEAYSFTYHPTSGRYKVVHVPCRYAGCRYSLTCNFNLVHVLTLGETTWRELQSGPGAAPRCNLAAGVVSVNGTTYWVTGSSPSAAKVVSFDFDDERVTSTTTLPAHLNSGDRYHLTEVHGRLGFIRGDHRVDVWVLEKGQRWSRRYNLGQCVPWPHFTFAGDCVLTVGDMWSFRAHQWKGVSSSSGWRLRSDNVVRIGYQDKGTLVASMQCVNFDDYFRVFAYVETNEPLNVYMAN